MIDIPTESNIDVLRQVALLQDREIQRLHARPVTLMTAAGADVVGIQQELDALREQIAQRNRALFGPSSEKRPAPSTPSPTAERTRAGHGPTPQPRLPVVDEVSTLPTPEHTCPAVRRPARGDERPV